jgi:hypothetical protein
VRVSVWVCLCVWVYTYACVDESAGVEVDESEGAHVRAYVCRCVVCVLAGWLALTPVWLTGWLSSAYVTTVGWLAGRSVGCPPFLDLASFCLPAICVCVCVCVYAYVGVGGVGV